jgi:hypothetical protein
MAATVHAELLERRQRDTGAFLYFRIFDDDPNVGELGNTEVADGDPVQVKNALKAEAQRLRILSVGRLIDLN